VAADCQARRNIAPYVLSVFFFSALTLSGCERLPAAQLPLPKTAAPYDSSALNRGDQAYLVVLSVSASKGEAEKRAARARQLILGFASPSVFVASSADFDGFGSNVWIAAAACRTRAQSEALLRDVRTFDQDAFVRASRILTEEPVPTVPEGVTPAPLGG
jgi:hypothetical protein